MIKNLLFTAKLALLLVFSFLSLNFAAQTTVTQTLTTLDGVFTVQECGVTSITVETWGAGGGGAAGSWMATGGGGGGAYAKKTFAVTVGDSFNYYVGRGGSGGSSNKDGGDTWFKDATFVMAKGGKGGVNNDNKSVKGGLASESIGDVKYSGGSSGIAVDKGRRIWGVWVPDWFSGGGGGAATTSGIGGDASYEVGGSSASPGGNGGNGDNSLGAGGAGTNYGGGGAGVKAGIWASGANGAQGLIRITYTKDNATPIAVTAATQITTTPTTDFGCTNNNITLQAKGGYTGAGVSTLWYEGNTCPNFRYIQEFMGSSYSVSNATIGTLNNGNRTFYSGTTIPADPQIHMENVLTSPIDPTLYKYIVVRYRVVSGTGGNVEIFFKKNGKDLADDKRVNGTINSDGNWHIMTIGMSTNTNWNNTGGDITGWRFDFTTNHKVEMEIDYLALSSVPILENTNEDDSQISLQINEASKTIGSLRISDQALICGSTIPFTTCVPTTIERKDRRYTGTTGGNWSIPENWTFSEIPNSTNCVFVDSSRSVLVDIPNAGAKTLQVADGGAVEITSGNALTVTRGITNLGNGVNFVVRDGANLNQIENSAANVGAITVENTFTLSAGRQQYNYVISPVKGQSLKTIYNGIPFVIYHNENTNFFYNAGDGDYVAGKGFAVKEPTLAAYPLSTTSVTGKYKGVPFNGTLDYPIAYTTDKVNVSHGWNLIGNPYPSSLDLIEFYNKAGNKDKIESTFKFWDNRNNLNTTQQGSNYGGSNYALFNVESGTSGTGTSIGSSIATERKPTRYVKPGIAFIVRAKSTANGATLHFDNSYRSVAAAPDFHGKQNAEQDDRFWLNLTSPTGITVTNAVVYFPRGNNDYASDDSDYQNLSDDIYTIVGNNKLAIQGKASFEDNDVLPLGINTFKAGSYTISLNEKEGKFANGQAIYLKDKQLNIVTNLSEGAYTFETAAGEHTGRFEIVYLPTTTLGTQTAVKSGLVVYKDGGDFVLKNTDTMNKLDVYDMSGRMIHSAKPQDKEFRLHANTMNSGVYILQVQTPSGIQTKRVIK
ncbi:T9SS type A sorting domain-containing protein [Chryseobacterium sp. HSC-36S06]|uniref:T9SS type A sorting domain-containing protein n=1 Tax=Chryseobacterium sp. HSC-36S06 TaxID=2910970 RepID=UPI00209CCA93|nr:T9SS type A sorting domain-containing protein [Chryseobacterium sp. HSC-36S06]MCP2037695.1 hypothetical protein [Chryseobacterium sp. HSC-36S06]